MSYAHTKRRKLIAKLKRQEQRKWRAAFTEHCAAVRKKLDGPRLGSLESLAQ